MQWYLLNFAETSGLCTHNTIPDIIRFWKNTLCMFIPRLHCMYEFHGFWQVPPQQRYIENLGWMAQLVEHQRGNPDVIDWMESCFSQAVIVIYKNTLYLLNKLSNRCSNWTRDIHNTFFMLLYVCTCMVLLSWTQFDLSLYTVLSFLFLFSLFSNCY